MIEDHATAGEAAEQTLPFDLRTVLIALWIWRWRLVVVGIVAGIAGVVAGLSLGERTWEAEATLLYRPLLDESEHGLLTRQHLVKTRPNIEVLRERQQLPVSLEELGRCFDIDVQDRTDLLFVRGTWDSAQGAADVTNGLAEVFQEQLVELRRQKLVEEIEGYEESLANTDARLVVAEAELSRFRDEHAVVEIDEQIAWYLDELVQLDVLRRQTGSQLRAVNRQSEDLGQIVDELMGQVAQEQKQVEDTEGIHVTNLRIQRLRSTIDDERAAMENAAELERAREELSSIQRLWEQGYVSDFDYQEARTGVEVIEARTVDTPRIAVLKDQLADLDDRVLPSGAPGETFSMPILREITLRDFEIRLDRSSLQVQEEELLGAVADVQERLDHLTAIRSEHDALVREVTSLEKEKQDTRDALAAARRSHSSDAFDFVAVHEARAPSFPSESNRRLLFAAVSMLVLLGGWGLLVARALWPRGYRSAAELRSRVEVPVLGSTSWTGGSSGVAGTGVEWRRLARRLLLLEGDAVRRRILITSAVHGEGCADAGRCLARVASGGGRNVLLVRVTPAEAGPTGASGEEDSAAAASSLHRLVRAPLEWLGSRLPSSLGSKIEPAVRRLGEITGPALRFARGLDGWLNWRVLRLGGTSSAPLDTHHHASDDPADLPERGRVDELLVKGPGDLRRLLDGATRPYEHVLIIAPAVLVDEAAESFAPLVDHAVLLIRSQGPPMSAVREAVSLLGNSGTPLSGAILHGVRAEYRDPIWGLTLASGELP